MNIVTNLPEWDLTDFFSSPDDPDIDAKHEKLDQKAKAFAEKYEGKLETLSAEALAEAIISFEKIEEDMGFIGSYAGLLHASDAEKYGAFLQKVRERQTDISSPLIFFSLELNQLPEAHLEGLYQKDKKLAFYKPWLENLRRYRPYQLSQSDEKILHEKSVTGRQAWVRLFEETEARLRFPIAGEKATLSTALNLMSDADQAVRKEAAFALGTVLKEQLPLFATITNVLAKDKAIEDGMRGLAQPISSRNLANQVEDHIVEELIGAVKDAFPRLSHRYYALKARWMGQDKLQFYDRLAPLPDQDNREISFDQARETVLSAWQSFSPQMAEKGAVFFEKGWIDVPPREGKNSGAFAHPSVPSHHPYILLNWHSKPRDVMTLAHELGHGVHQCLAAEQGLLLAGTPLTLAETASVFGEMLTFRALLDQTETPLQRKIMLAEKIEDMLNTVVRQISFLNFERKLHDIRKERELSEEDLSKLWLATSRESLGPALEWDDTIYGTYWAYVPHFIHTPFYVYAYAFGDCLVNALYECYRQGNKDFETHYIALLSAGGSKKASELLAPFGLDLNDRSFWAIGLGVIEKMIDELEALFD